MISVDVRTVAEPKDLRLPTPKIQTEIKTLDEKTFEITITSDSYAKALKIDGCDLKAKFSDNFFDLLPNKPKTIICRLEQKASPEQVGKALKWQSYPYKEAA